MQRPVSKPHPNISAKAPQPAQGKPDRGELAVRMARLFPSAIDTLEVLRAVGMDVGPVPPSSRPAALVGMWRAALAAAETQGRLPALLDAARQRYGHDRAIVAQDAVEPVRTFFLPLAMLGVSLGVAVALGTFLFTLDSTRWTRIDTMTPNFADLEVRAQFRTVAPPGWAFWLAPAGAETPAPAKAPDAGPIGAAPTANQAVRGATATPAQPATAPASAAVAPENAHGAEPAASASSHHRRDPGLPSRAGPRLVAEQRAAGSESSVRPGIPPYAPAALPARTILSRTPQAR